MDCDPAVSQVAECFGRSLHIEQRNDDDDDDDELFSLPSAKNLVSAMKGEGGPRKLRVKWAPEVYDPIPTSVSHTLTNKNRNGKKNKKNKCKCKDKAKKKHSRRREEPSSHS